MFDDHRIRQQAPSGPTRLPAATAAQLLAVHAICEQFEANWSERVKSTIEQLVSESPESLRPYLLESLARSEVELLATAGKEVDPSDYLKRFKHASGIVARAFVPIDELEHWDLTGQWMDNTETEVASHSEGQTPQETHFRQSMPVRLGPFDIIEEIASGGMGVVYRGRHSELNRDVAVKCLRAGLFANEAEIQRFRKEAQTVAALKHSGIVPIYEIGSEGGLHYFAMPLIDGVDLGVRITSGPIGYCEIAKIARDAAVATHFAHKHGIVHRDLKPRNILIDREQKVWVTDFGLAKVTQTHDILSPSLEAMSDLTASGEVIGTPSYMAPEQLHGTATVLSDVYALGAVLYAGLTGRPPHQAATLLQTLKNISESEPVTPRLLDPQIPRDLETITLKALQRSASERYSTAEQLAADLDRFLEGRPIFAKSPSSAERIWRWVKREPTIASLSFGVMLALTLGLGISVWFYSLAAQNARNATANANLAMASVEEYLTNVADSPELREKGLEGLRRNLLRSALTFYEQLTKQSSDRPILNDRIAQAHFRLGLIHADLGDIPQALAQFDEALVDYRVLWQRDSDKPQMQRLIAETLEQRSQLHKQLGEPTTAVTGLIEAIAECRSLVEHKDNFANRALLASLVAQLGDEHAELGRAQEEEDTFEEVAHIVEVLAQSTEHNVPSQDLRRMVRALDRLGLNFQKRARFDDAEKWFRFALKVCQSQVVEPNRDPELRFIIARLHKNLNQLYATSQRMDLAKSEFEAAEKQLVALSNEHPLVLNYLDVRAALLSNRGVQMVLQEDFASAETVLNETIRLQEQVIARQPDAFGNYNNLCNMYNSLGAALSNQRKYREAEIVIRRGMHFNARGREMAAELVSVDFFGLNLKTSLANVLVAQRNYLAAFEILKDVTPAIELLVESNPTSPQYRITAIGALRSSAVSQLKLGQTQTAIIAARSAIQGYDQLPPPYQKSWTVTRIVTDASLALARCQVRENQLVEAQTSLQRAIAFIESLLSAAELSSFRMSLVRSTRGEAHHLAGKISAAKLQPEAAVEHLTKAIDDQIFLVESLQDHSSEVSLSAREALSESYNERARALIALGRIDQAMVACHSAITLYPEEKSDAEAILLQIQRTDPKP